MNHLYKKQENPAHSDNIIGDTEEHTLSLLQKIRAGTIVPKSIRPSERRLLISYLMTDGYCTAEIAQTLDVSDRTIERDKKTIREANAIATDSKLVEQVVGRLVLEAELSIQRIRKVVRDTDTPHNVKIEAEYRCFQIINEMTKSLQSLGYLPNAATKLQAEITHSIGHIPELSEIEFEYKRLKQISEETEGTDPRLIEQLTNIRTQIVKAQLADQIQTVSRVLEDKGEHDNE